ncbi:hypothetical protein P1A20_14030 [Staphylococcus equorum]|uniref:hypothetical protein n=1 Tax=Staphylococcus equorum TaxID=246432 RepID=UPI002557A569|nr:hypothetical protein [Staphylococcus equorum]MDK9847694.1 hypothetical protein [Staphylococcus equorum]
MLKTYTEIIGSELPIYVSKSESSNLVFRDEREKQIRYELAGYYLYSAKKELYKELYKPIR